MKNVFYQTEKAGGGASPQAAAPRFLKMKCLFALLFALFVGMQGAWAYDFSNSYYGKTFYFNIIDQTNHYVEVTYPNTSISPWYGFDKPKNQVSIPSEIGHEGITYTVTTIGEYAFYDCSEMYGLVIPNTVTTIGKYAFYFCGGLTGVTIPSSVTTIGAGAFSDCSSLSTVNIQNGVATIGASAFERTSISTVTIPSSVTSLGDYAFSNCSNLTSVWINSNAVASKDYTSVPNLRDNFGNQVKYYFLGTDVTVIGKQAFFGASLESVTMPSVTAIFENAFASCWSLTSVTMPSSLTGIHERAFYDCRELNSLSLNEGLTLICDDAFASCTRLTSVTIPSTVDFMGAVFSNCSSLTSVTINSNDVASMAFLKSRFGDQVKHYILGTGVTSIGGSAFKGCTRLTSVTLPESLTTIEDFAFDGCRGLTSLTLPSNVTSIGWEAFNGCSNIASMIVRATTPPTTGPDPFDGVSTYIPVRVPWGTAHSYRENDEWSRFTIIMDNLVADTPVTIPYTQLFYDEQVSTPLPEGWHSFTATSRVHDYDYLNMTGINGSDVVMLPPVSSSSAPWLQMQYQGTTNASTLEIGYVTDPNLYDASTFVSTKSFKGTAWNTIVAELPTLPSGARYALKSTGEIHVDHVKLFDPSTMSANNAVYYEQNFDVNSNAIPEGWLTFNGQTSIQGSGASRHLQINGNEFVLLPKLTASAQKRRVMEVDVRIINTGNSTTATVNVGYMPSMDNYDGSMFVSQQQLTCAANATSKKRLYVYTDTQQSSRRFAIKTTGNATVQVDDVQVYYTYESPQQNDFICDFSNNPINTTTVPNAGAYTCLVGQPNGNLYTNHGTTNNWKTGTVNGVSDEHAYCDISGTEAVSSWLVMPFVKVTANNRLLSYDIAVTHKNGTQQPVNASQVHSSQFLKVYISVDGYNWDLKRTYTSSDLAAIPPTGEEVGYIRLSEYVGQTIKVAFHASCNAGVNNNYRVHIDNVTHSNFVLSPPQNVEATNVGYEEATIRWEYTHPAQSGGFVYVPYPGNQEPPAANNLSEIWSELTDYSSGYWQQADNYSNQCNITNLQRGTTYTAYVCTNSISPLQWVSCTFTTQNDCPTPTNLSAEVQDCMALIRWDDNGASDWEYALKKDGQYQYYEWEGQQYYEVPTYGANMVFFGDDYYNSLEPGNYSIEVRSVCDEGNYDSYGGWSESLGFTITECNFSYPAPAFSLVNIDDVDKLTLAWSDLPLPHPAASVNVTLQFHSNQSFYSGTDVVGWSDYVTDGTTIKQYTSNDYSLIDAGRTFYVRLRAFYTLPDGSAKQSEWSETITVTMPEPCAAVTNIAEEVTENAINLTWEGSAVSYEVRYRPEGSSDDYNTVVTETNSVSIDDFMPHTSYEASIIATCDYGLTSEPVSFMFNNIQFEDANVKDICVAIWDDNDDGELSYGEAAAVENLNETFYENGDIVTFNELRYFTGLRQMSGEHFYGCTSLTSIVIPASVTSIISGVWGNCPALESIAVDAGNTVFASPDNCNAIIKTAANELVVGCKSTVIPYGVEKIGQWAFGGCTSLTSIDIPASVTTIGNDAFNNCSGLTTLTLPASVTHIIDGAFWGCTGLVSMTVEATTPPMITESHDPFSTAVANNIVVYVPCGSLDDYQNEESGWHYLNLIENCIQFEDDNVKDICVANWDTNGDGELSYAEAAAVTNLDYMFRNNMDITKFDELKYFTGLESLADSDFESCTNLQKITIPKSVSTIGNLVFAHCTSLTQLKVDAENPTFDSRDECNAIIETATNTLVVGLPNTVIPNTVETIRYWAFAHQYSMTTIEIPNSVTAILGGAFYFCTNLQSVTLPSNLESIGGQAFEGCNSLTTLTLPASLQTIGNQAFAGCFSLTRISVGADTPPVLGRDVFASVDKNIPVYVPCAAVMDYRTDEGWRVFTNIQCNNGDIIVSPGYPYEFGFETAAIAWSMTSPGGWDYQCTTTPHSGDRCAYKSGESVSELRTPAIHFDASCDNLVLRFWAKGSGRLFVYYGEDLEQRTVISTIANTNEWTLQEFSLSRFMASQTEKTAKFAFSNDYSIGTPKDLYIDDIEVVANAYDKIFDGYQIRRWEYANSWYPSGEPTSSDNVLIASTVQVGGQDGTNPLTAYANTISFAEHSYIQVNQGSVLEATQINYKDSDNVRIKDGGQLKVANDSYVQMYKRFVGYENQSISDHWYLFAPPMTGTNSVPYQFTTGNYDLYGFDGTADLEWLNYKNHTQDFQMQNGKGYLYAHERPTGDNDYIEVIMNGWVNKTTEDMTIDGLTHGENTKNNPFYNWNLVGNPFPCNAYLSGNRPFYRLEETDEGSKIVLAENNVIKPMEGVFVQAATADGNSVTFTTTAPDLGASMDFSLRKANTTRGAAATLDRTRVQFGESLGLGHLDLMASANRLYIPQRGKDMAVVGTEPVGELPLHFEAAENGTYTLGFENAAEGLVYCHLIDNLTGADVDLLQQPEYTFEAKTTDYASRFRLVFRATENGDDTTGTEGDSFAFIDAAGNIVITNTEAGATLQVIDVTGRVVLSTDDARNVSTNGMTAGVYVLRLIDGDDVKVQKIVVD